MTTQNNAPAPLRPPLSSLERGESNKEGSGIGLIQNPRFTLDKDVILSHSTRTALDECLARLRFHQTIYQQWNFSCVDPMGRTAILNFYGPPGTGKTLCAEALAGQLRMPFIALGIAELESKFMGETAKNIQAAFATAKETGALLFFDEADTLLGKRLSSVTQGVDNEVNAMRSTLLIELERFEGIVIFATNFARNYDEAFRSRIGYHVEFTLPDLAARQQLWNKFLVAEIPLSQARETLLEAVSDLSEGLAGREIRTCMRLALPKVLLEAEQEEITPQLGISHLRSAIEQVFASHQAIATHSGRTASEVSTAKKLLGIQ
ncbi:ATP-binding protein [Pectobacterium aquaticum]|uniref:ATP-binding protein n=2 Tax=Pectobacterium aquaticum TaxID=2204145 RepID=A0AA93DL52_9GAMM|nr:ATP-binding protein [Pectobacterium aquaticum]RRN94508.1 ATP-binding protein [Pectobacterium aquaticum]RRO03038.1 ATP-binding protein [Pectobacterium aquaticum]RRO08568.1 ATP-binding protein [Pectobacterium aquaticum]RRO11474.1 ATP-binding protein [Pectobacterium aquaticum]RRO17386.1 ATP-binding protein [Pectobacterium aquaticum]